MIITLHRLFRPKYHHIVRMIDKANTRYVSTVTYYIREETVRGWPRQPSGSEYLNFSLKPACFYLLVLSRIKILKKLRII